MKRLFLFLVPITILSGVAIWVLPRAGSFFGKEETVEPMPSGREFYASPEGTPNGDGSMNSPWDLQTALNQPPSIAPGDILNLREGTYKAPDGAHFFCKLKGAQDKYILIRPQGQEHVVIESGIEVDGPWVIIRDLEVTNNNPDRLSEQEGTFPTDVLQVTGFNVFASNVKLINNVVHDNASGINAWAQAPDGEYYGNLVYYNGWHTVEKHPQGSGINMQNISGTKFLRDNLVFSQFASGIQLYGSDKADLNNFHVEGNIVFNNGALNNEHNRNLLLGGGKVAKNPVVIDNYMYFPPELTLGGDHNIGYYPFGMGCTNLKFTGNYISADGGALNLFKCTVDELEGNTLYGEIKGFTKDDYPDNKYYDRANQARGVKIFVRPNRYEAGRANIAIFNWNHVSMVEVNLDGVGLKPGDSYELHSAQDYFGDVANGVYEGKPIKISMLDRTVASPIGVPAPPSTFPEFGAFVIRKAAPSAPGAAE